MATYKSSRDVNLFTIAGIDVSDDFDSLTIAGAADELDATTIKNHTSVNAGQRQYNINFGIKTQTASCPTKVNSSHMTVASIGGVDYTAVVKSIDFSLNTTLAETSAAADVFKSSQALTFGFEATAEIMVLASAAQAIFTTFKTAASSLSAVWSLTLNSIVITTPMVITSVELVVDGANINVLRVGLKPLAPCTGAYPTAPTTGTDLISSFLLDPLSTAVFDFESAATNGENIEIDVVLQSFSLSIAAGQIVQSQYSFVSSGAPIS